MKKERCNICGLYLKPNEKYCPYCVEDRIEELEAYGLFDEDIEDGE